MTFLPIVARELRAGARRRGTYWIRMVSAFLGIVVLLWIMLIPELRSPQNMGKALFVGLSITSFIYALLIGMFTTADSVSEEKREGTLGLLFLTDLKGYDIVLGKLAATSLNAIYGLMALFPVMAIPMLAGGVTAAEVIRVMLVTTNSIFFSLVLGMFVSAVTRDERVAMALTLGLLVFVTAGLPFFGALLTNWGEQHAMSPLFYLFSPAFACITAFEGMMFGPGASQTDWFYWSLLCVHVLGWIFLLLACFIMPRSWQDKVSGSGKKSGEVWQQWRYGSNHSRAAFRRRVLGRNPFRWLASRDRIRGVLVWIFLAAMALLWLWGLAALRHEWLNATIYVTTGIVLNTVMKLWMASEACRQVGQDRKSGALELMLSTPLSIRQIVEGQMGALWRQFAGPVGAVLLVEFIFLMRERQDKTWVLVCVAGMSILVADLVALAWVGMWMGVRSRTLHRASGAAMVRVLVLPWMIYGVLLTALVVMSYSTRSPYFASLIEKSGDKFFVGAWFLISALVDFVFIFWARRQLLRHFRQAATFKYESRRGWFRKEEAKAPAGA